MKSPLWEQIKSQFCLDYVLVLHTRAIHQLRLVLRTWKRGLTIILNLCETLHNIILSSVVSLSPTSESIFHSLFKSSQRRKLQNAYREAVWRVLAHLFLPVLSFSLLSLLTFHFIKLFELLPHMKKAKTKT